jgi:hypothetical protein
MDSWTKAYTIPKDLDINCVKWMLRKHLSNDDICLTLETHVKLEKSEDGDQIVLTIPAHYGAWSQLRWAQ